MSTAEERGETSRASGIGRGGNIMANATEEGGGGEGGVSI